MIHLPIAPGSQPRLIGDIPAWKTLDEVKNNRSVVQSLLGPKVSFISQGPSDDFHSARRALTKWREEKNTDIGVPPLFAIFFSESSARLPVNELAVPFWETNDAQRMYPLRGDILILLGDFDLLDILRIVPLTLENFQEVCQESNLVFVPNTFIDFIPYRRPEDIAQRKYQLFLVHNEDRTHQLDQLNDLMFDQVTGAPKINQVAVDTEGTDLDLVQLAFSITDLEGEKQKYVALLHHLRSVESVKQGIIAFLKRLLEDPSVTKVFHGASNDRKMLQEFGINLVKMIDAETCAKFSKSRGIGHDNKLQGLALEYGVPFNVGLKDAIKSIFGRVKRKTWSCPLDKRPDLVDYTVQDVLNLCELKDAIIKDLSPEEVALLFEKSNSPEDLHTSGSVVSV